MEGAVRVFAGEFGRSTLSVPGEDDGSSAFVVTPGGAYCRQMFIAGALTELEESGDFLKGRVADPTGGFDLVIGGKNTEIVTLFQKMPLPSFVSVLGKAQLYRRNGTYVLSVRPDHVAVIDRIVRDRWVLSTAAATMKRLDNLMRAIHGGDSDPRVSAAVRHYHLCERDLDELAAMVENAVGSVRPPETVETEKPDVNSLVLDLLATSKDPRGVAVQDILDTLAGKGILQQDILSAIESLIVEDECYQPQKGFIRRL